MTGPPPISTGKSLTNKKHQNSAPCFMTPLMKVSSYRNAALNGSCMLSQSVSSQFTLRIQGSARVSHLHILTQLARGEPGFEHASDLKAKEYTNLCFYVFQPKLDSV